MGMRDILRQEKEREAAAQVLWSGYRASQEDVREWPGKMVFASPGMEPSVGCNGMTVLWAGAEGQCPYCKGR